MTNLKTLKVFTKKNSTNLTDTYGGISADLNVVAGDADEADAILTGMSGCRAQDIICDLAMTEGFDVVRDATPAEIAEYNG